MEYGTRRPLAARSPRRAAVVAVDDSGAAGLHRAGRHAARRPDAIPLDRRGGRALLLAGRSEDGGASGATRGRPDDRHRRAAVPRAPNPGHGGGHVRRRRVAGDGGGRQRATWDRKPGRPGWSKRPGSPRSSCGSRSGRRGSTCSISRLACRAGWCGGSRVCRRDRNRLRASQNGRGVVPARPFCDPCGVDQPT